MKRIAVFAALLIAVAAQGGNLDFAGSGDVVIRSYDRTIVVSLDGDGDGSPERAFVVGMEKPLDKAIELRWKHVSAELEDGSLVITDAANRRAFIAATKEKSAIESFTVKRVSHVIGVAHYWGLQPGFDLETLSKNW